MEIGQPRVVEAQQWRIVACRSWTETGSRAAFQPISSVSPCEITSLDASAGHPDQEAIGVMIAPVPFLGDRHPAEFAAPDDQRGVEQSSTLEVGQEGRDRPIGLHATLAVIVGQVVMRVPFVIAVNLDEAHSTLDQPASQEALLAVGRVIVGSSRP